MILKKSIIPMLCALLLSNAAFATVGKQAGDIADGIPATLSNDQIVSYYKTGKAGVVRFSCSVNSLTTSNVKILLTGGKNLAFNLPAILSNGINGPYVWKFKHIGPDVGNIKLRMLTDKGSAEVRCVETY